jgi:hypothetical protein
MQGAKPPRGLAGSRARRGRSQVLFGEPAPEAVADEVEGEDHEEVHEGLSLPRNEGVWGAVKG